MKKIVFLFLIFASCPFTYSQVIRGTVYDKTTRSAIYSASVYFNGTSVGTLTDQNGNFQLDISKFRSMPLTISAIGYYSVLEKDISAGKPLLIYLVPKLFELEEVVVSAKPNRLERMESMTIFRNEFIGTTGNAMNCKIENEDDIRIKYSADKDTIKAFATKPIIITNKALGYNITYFLDKFEYSKQGKSFSFSGNIIFREDSSADDKKRRLFELRRKAAYLGSRMHFFRSLWANDLNANGFTVRNSANEIVNYSNIVYKKDERSKYLSYHTNLGISYYSKQPTSFIILYKDKIFFDASGYYDPTSIGWEGEMSLKRVADMLPFDYYVK